MSVLNRVVSLYPPIVKIPLLSFTVASCPLQEVATSVRLHVEDKAEFLELLCPPIVPTYKEIECNATLIRGTTLNFTLEVSPIRLEHFTVAGQCRLHISREDLGFLCAGFVLYEGGGGGGGGSRINVEVDIPY